MTQEDLVKQMARRVANIAGVAFETLPIKYQDRNIRTARELVQLVMEAGYVKLSDNQEIDIPDAIFLSLEARATGFTKRSFWERGWRRIEL